MRITGNGKLVELEAVETPAFEEHECWLRIREPDPSKGTPAIYAWCLSTDPEFPLPRDPR